MDAKDNFSKVHREFFLYIILVNSVVFFSTFCIYSCFQVTSLLDLFCHFFLFVVAVHGHSLQTVLKQFNAKEK